MTGFLESLATSTFANLLTGLVSSYKKSKKSTIDIRSDQLETDLENHFLVTFNKCMNIKTILSDSPVEFLSIYTDQNFAIGNDQYDQYDLVQKIKDNYSCCISGTGGGGKSMFVRYLWLSVFENPEGKIPFFLELRHLNGVTHKTLENFIYHTIIDTGSSVSQSVFKTAMKNGEFILFFDGFDELNHELRDNYEKQIIALKENNPELTIVVTSRPDERFSGWHQFHNVKVLPMTKDQVVDLIGKIDYCEDTKKSLLNKIDDGLFETHSGFLSNPLLASMMLVTISYNPDIPVKMFGFYEQAFEALYYRHDLTKGGYKRKLLCHIGKHDFIKLLSYFCLISYFAEEYEFSEAQLIQYVEKAINVEAEPVVLNDFINDLIEGVCILKKEGIEYSFTHRSLQEYFAAYCLARVTSKNIEQIFSNFAKRHSDQVIGMVYDMNPYLFRERYLTKIYNEYLGFFNTPNNRNLVKYFLKYGKASFSIMTRAEGSSLYINRRIKKNDVVEWLFRFTNDVSDFYDFYANIKRLLVERRKVKEKSHKEFLRRREKDEEFASYVYQKMKNVRKIDIGVEDELTIRVNGRVIKDEEVYEKFQDTGMYSFIFNNAKLLKEFVKAEIKEFENVTQNLDELF